MGIICISLHNAFLPSGNRGKLVDTAQPNFLNSIFIHLSPQSSSNHSSLCPPHQAPAHTIFLAHLCSLGAPLPASCSDAGRDWGQEEEGTSLTMCLRLSSFYLGSRLCFSESSSWLVPGALHRLDPQRLFTALPPPSSPPTSHA